MVVHHVSRACNKAAQQACNNFVWQNSLCLYQSCRCSTRRKVYMVLWVTAVALLTMLLHRLRGTGLTGMILKCCNQSLP